MCNKGPINTPVNPNNSGTVSSNSGTITAKVGNVGSLDNGGNATSITHIEVHPPNPNLYNNDAQFEVYAAETHKRILTYLLCGVIIILVLMLIGSGIAWYCSGTRNIYHENLRFADCGPQHNDLNNRSPYEQPRRSRRDEASLPLRVYNVPPSYAEITQAND
jgi:hypothetical protein